MKLLAAFTTSLLLTSCQNLPAILNDQSVKTIDEAIHIRVDSAALYADRPIAIFIRLGDKQ